MKKGKRIKRTLIGLLAIIMMISIMACAKEAVVEDENTSANTGQNSSETSEPSGTSETTEKLEPVHLTWSIAGAEQYENWPMDTIVEVTNQTGISWDIIDISNEKLQVLLASGEGLPDIIELESQTIARQMVQGGLAIALDPYLDEYGQNIVNNMPLRAKFSRNALGDDTGNLYWVPFQAGNDGRFCNFGTGFNLRWDYYKELGYPEVTSYDDYLNVVADMVAAHPTTEDGKKTYGFGIFTDWDMWAYWIFTGNTNHYADCNAGFVDVRTNEIVDMYNDPNNTLWDGLEFYNKAYQMGIFDVDSLTSKYNDYVAKATNGQYMHVLGTWMKSGFDAVQLEKNPNTMSAYEPIPVAGTSAYCNANYEAGLTTRLVCVTNNSEYPERAVQLIDFLNSFDGVRLVQSGIEGVHWDMVDGTPQLKDEILDLASTDPETLEKKMGLKFSVLYAGISPGEVHPDDGAPLSLFNTPKAWKLSMTAADKDFAAYYGAETKNEVFIKMLNEGTFFDISTWKTGINALLAEPPEDIVRIGNQLKEIWLKGAPKAILAESDEEFNLVRSEIMTELKEAGSEEYWAWYSKAWADAKSLYESYTN